ncbi:MAG: hypothetical protein Aurels2KO_57990 [Aureliella sp.]
MSKTRIFLIVASHLGLFVFVSYLLLGVRQDFVCNSQKLADISVDGYERYYEKWSEKRLEGAETFIRIAHEPDFALTVIDPLIGFIMFFIVVSFGQTAYYEHRHAKLLNKYKQSGPPYRRPLL